MALPMPRLAPVMRIVGVDMARRRERSGTGLEAWKLEIGEGPEVGLSDDSGEEREKRVLWRIKCVPRDRLLGYICGAGVYALRVKDSAT